jgi:transcriptional regulator with XRE-family HTH domain
VNSDDENDRREPTLDERAALIKELRTRRGFTQRDLAEAAGLTQGMVSRYEQGESEMEGGTIRAVARALGVSTDVLLGVAPLPTPEEEAAAMADDYPNRRLLRLSSEFRSAPAQVKAWLIGPNFGGDLSLSEWIDEFRMAMRVHEAGRLNLLLRGEGGNPVRPRKRK